MFNWQKQKSKSEALPGHLVCVLLQLLCVLSYAVKRGGVENWKIITRTSKCGRYKQEDKALCMQTPGKMKLYAASNLIMLVSVEQKALLFIFAPLCPKSFRQAAIIHESFKTLWYKTTKSLFLFLDELFVHWNSTRSKKKVLLSRVSKLPFEFFCADSIP